MLDSVFKINKSNYENFLGQFYISIEEQKKKAEKSTLLKQMLFPQEI